jgi:mannose/fructose/N-acetylgalactosamine-specific phosphotransferase system component IID
MLKMCSHNGIYLISGWNYEHVEEQEADVVILWDIAPILHRKYNDNHNDDCESLKSYKIVVIIILH